MHSRYLALAILLISIAGFASRATADPATPEANATPFDCPITEPNGIQPPASGNVFGRGAGDYANEYLWTSLWIWGENQVTVPDDEHLQPDGSVIEMKWAWYRFVEGDLAIEGRRLDTDAPPLTAMIFNDSYGTTGFIPSGITFPSDGCWEVTGRVGEGSLTFVVLVVWPAGFVPEATPEASPVI